jgi:hypothetical protein
MSDDRKKKSAGDTTGWVAERIGRIGGDGEGGTKKSLLPE